MNEVLKGLRKEAMTKAIETYNKFNDPSIDFDHLRDEIFAEMVALECVKTYIRTNPNTQKFLEYGTKFCDELAATFRTKYE